MALASLRLRQALFLSPTLLKHSLLQSSSISSASLPFRAVSSPGVLSPSQSNNQLNQRHSFRSSSVSFDNRRSDLGDGKISPDEILFEGCDYNHWLITMDFPKDPKPTPEQMVETYVETLAKVVGSKEEAMKRMYACSTTTYNGFQAVMTEEMSEKFRGLPGVVFILPDSYIDPVNKEYGGDKYEMGKITPRPPPVQYGRQGRYGDRNRNYERPRFDRPSVPTDSMPMQSGNPPPPQYNHQGPQGDGQHYAQQRQPYNPSGQQPPQGYGGNPRPFAGQQESSQYDRRGSTGQGFQQSYAQTGRNDFPGQGRVQSSYQQTGFNQGGGLNFGTQGQGRVPQMQYGSPGETFQHGSGPGFQGHTGYMPNENPNPNSPGHFRGGQQSGFNQVDNVNAAPQGQQYGGPQMQYGGPGGTFEHGSGPGFQGSKNNEAINNTSNVHNENPNMNSPGHFRSGQDRF